MNKKENFLNGFSGDYEGVFVEIQAPNCPESEVIWNPKENFTFKKNYYKKAYNDNLELKSFPKIKIVGFTFE